MATPKKTRIRLNREIIKLRKGQLFVGAILNRRTKKCRERDQDGNFLLDSNNEPLWKDVALVDFKTPEGVEVSMFENGGLKNALDGVAQGQFVEIEYLGKKEMDDGKKQVNDYAVYAHE